MRGSLLVLCVPPEDPFIHCASNVLSSCSLNYPSPTFLSRSVNLDLEEHFGCGRPFCFLFCYRNTQLLTQRNGGAQRFCTSGVIRWTKQEEVIQVV